MSTTGESSARENSAVTQDRKERPRWGTYLLAMPGIAIISIIVTSMVIQTLSSSLYPTVRDISRSRMYVEMVNWTPPFLTGFVCVLGLTAWATPREHAIRRYSHVARAWPLYTGFIALAAFVYFNRGAHDFGYVSQLFIWPCGAFLGGALADGIGGVFRSLRDRNTGPTS